MTKEKGILMKVEDAIEAGKDSDGNVIKLPIFDSIIEIDGELYGMVEGYMDPPNGIDTNIETIH